MSCNNPFTRSLDFLRDTGIAIRSELQPWPFWTSLAICGSQGTSTDRPLGSSMYGGCETPDLCGDLAELVQA